METRSPSLEHFGTMFPEAVRLAIRESYTEYQNQSTKAVDASLAGVEPALFEVPVVFRAGSKLYLYKCMPLTLG